MAPTRRSVREYLDTLDDAAWGAASPVKPKFVSRSDPAAQWTGAHKDHAFFAYSTNYLIDLDHAVIVDVEPSRAIRQAEVGATRTMIERTEERFGLYPERWAADTAYGSAENLAWLVHERGIEPHIPVRMMLERVEVMVIGETERAELICHWSGGATTKHVFTRPVRRFEQLEHFDKLLARIIQLRTQGATAQSIAETLNIEGWTPPKKDSFNAPMIHRLLQRRGLGTTRPIWSGNVPRQHDGEVTLRNMPIASAPTAKPSMDGFAAARSKGD